MGRSKGTVETVLEEKDIERAVTDMEALMPEMLKGAMTAAPRTIFPDFATDSVLVEFLWDGVGGASWEYPIFLC